MLNKQYYTYSLDEESNLVNVCDAIKGVKYFCPCCGAEMIPRQGIIRKWHFAHKANFENCSYESYLQNLKKKRIRECFERVTVFEISFLSKALCSIKECPLGVVNRCSWNEQRNFDLKQFYDTCEEEVNVDGFRADLLLTNNRKKSTPPILIEIYVTHKSTMEKINSENRIIEIKIETEDDIEQLVSSRAFIENSETKFFNFRTEYLKEPNMDNQPDKYSFWIDAHGFFHFSNKCGNCLSPNRAEIEASIFHIESTSSVDWDMAFFELSKSGLNIKFCTMCEFYNLNSSDERTICRLYRVKGLRYADNCPYFKQINYSLVDKFKKINYPHPYKITINKDK